MEAEILLKAAIPCFAEICCVVAQIDTTETKDASAKSNFHWKTMKSRLIIDTLSEDVLAYPVYDTISSIYVVTSVDFFKSGKLQKALTDMNVTWSPPRPVTPEVYGNCLRYSMQFAIAPRWNRVGPYMISSKYFLTFPGYSATNFNVTVRTDPRKNSEAIIKLKPIKIKMSNVTLENLGIPQNIICHFMADRKGFIDIASLGTFRVLVLPSLKRGKIISAMKKIPATSPFKNYGELKRHWKNMYGYRLPDSDRDMIYYDIYFPMPTCDHFIYPNICVRSKVIESAYLGDRRTIVANFSQDLTETMPKICGKSVVIEMNPEYELENASEVMRSRENLQEFDRGNNTITSKLLSFSTPRQSLSQMSRSMSPTPSLRGKKQPISPKKASNFSSESQNHCPTAGNSKKTDLFAYSFKIKKSGDLPVRSATFSEKMDIEDCQPSMDRPFTSFRTPFDKPFFSRSISSPECSMTTEKMKISITDDQIRSKFFGAPNTSVNCQTIEKSQKKMTVSQKLDRNSSSPMKQVKKNQE